MGTLRVIRRGNKVGRVLPHHLEKGRKEKTSHTDKEGDSRSWYVYIKEEDLPEGEKIVCEVPMGSFLLFNNIIPHCSGENHSNQIRWSVDLRMCPLALLISRKANSFFFFYKQTKVGNEALMCLDSKRLSLCCPCESSAPLSCCPTFGSHGKNGRPWIAIACRRKRSSSRLLPPLPSQLDGINLKTKRKILSIPMWRDPGSCDGARNLHNQTIVHVSRLWMVRSLCDREDSMDMYSSHTQ